MNEIKISLLGIVVGILFVVIVCLGIIHYYKGADSQLDREFKQFEKLNNQLVSETRELQTGLASHSARIGSVTKGIGTNKRRIEHIYTGIERSAKETADAVRIIEQCEEIIKKVKTQK